MSARRRTQLICSAMFGALVISCAAPPVYVVAPPAPQAQQEQRGGQQAEQAPVEQQPPAEQQQPPPVEQQQPAQPPVVVLQPPVVSQPGPASQGGGVVARVPGGSQSRQTTGGQQRPSGNAPGVGHNLPNIGADYRDKNAWENNQRQECKKALGPGHDNCVTLHYQWFTMNGPGELDTTHAIGDPTPNYANKDKYGSCTAEDINPPDDGPPVPSGTTIAIKIGCIPADQDQNGATTQNGTTTQTTGEQQGGNNQQAGTNSQFSNKQQTGAKQKDKHGKDTRPGG